MMIDMSKFGDCFAAERIENQVTFWCDSLDGDSTDSRQVTVKFKDEATAAAIYSIVNMPPMFHHLDEADPTYGEALDGLF